MTTEYADSAVIEPSKRFLCNIVSQQGAKANRKRTGSS